MMKKNLSFGYWVRRRRKAMDLTQSELGRLVGASEIMIRKIEADERRPSRQLTEVLAIKLALPEDERELFLQAARKTAAVEKLPEINDPILKPHAPPSNLPAQMTSMVNRVSDLEVVKALIWREDVRIITIIGPPGIGKTRLSIKAAEQALNFFLDGVWFIDLSTVNEPELILQTIAVTLGMPPMGSLSPDKLLNQILKDKELLLVLDNLEQVVEQAALDIANLLRTCRKVKVLATSRIRLDIYGEHEYILPPLSVPAPAIFYDVDQLMRYEAVQLFVVRASQYQSSFLLTDQTAAPVAEICQRMDGIPLALELAAVRLRTIPVNMLAEVMREASGTDWLKLFRSSALDVPQRQRTLLDTVAWSYSLLNAELQSMLRQLSVFSGSFDWTAVSSVVDIPALVGEASVFEGFEELINHNLVSEVSDSPKRWRLLEMVREFSESELALEESKDLRHRHAEYYINSLTQSKVFSSRASFLSELYIEVNTMRSALHFALEISDAALAHQIAQVMGFYWETRGLLEEGRRSLN
jgi:predicted ATPase/DNA-binding XRE family transcriptional regulator